MDMRLGISSFAYAWAIGVPGYGGAGMDVLAFLRRCCAHGVKLVQIADNLPVHQLGNQGFDDLISLERELGISVQLGMRGCAPDFLLRYLGFCERLRAPLLRVVIDSKQDKPDPHEAARRFRLVARDFERSGVVIAIENHDRFKARELRQVIEESESGAIGSCIDSVNSFGAAEGTETVLSALGPSALCLHIKDFAIDRLPHNMGFTIRGVPAGKGLLDLPAVIADLASCGREPDAFLELWPPLEGTIEETVAKEELWVGESLDYLSSFKIFDQI
jgi:3-oxoisoapionate decarboxylase